MTMDWCLELLLWNYTGSGTVGDPGYYMTSFTNTIWQPMTSKAPLYESELSYREKNEDYEDGQESCCISQFEEEIWSKDEICCNDEIRSRGDVLSSFDDVLSEEVAVKDCFVSENKDPETPEKEDNNGCAVCLGLNYNNDSESLDVTIMECRELPTVHVSLKKHKLNPYVKSYLTTANIKYGKKKTRTMPGSTNPKFYEIFRYYISHSRLQDLMLIVAAWHHSKFGRNFCIGQTTIQLKDFCFGEPFPRWYKLEHSE